MTIHSSKGLEFPRVILVGIGQLDDGEESRSDWARLLYVGMTRAQDYLLMTTSRDNLFSRELMETVGR
jgi:superfamily I DNA/RNA helicase